MRASSVAAFVAVDALLVLTPGPDWAYVIAVGVREGLLLPAVAGLVTGYAGLTVLVAAGLGAVIATTPGALTAVTLIGGAYLVWLGACVVGRRVAPPADADGRRPASGLGVAVRGAGTSGLNPKGLLLFMAVLPQFVDRAGRWPLPLQIILLGAVHMTSCGVGYLALGSVARAVFRARPTVLGALTRAAGGAMIILGALLLVERAFTSSL
jgi:threonine/homoserine/homoserine lactone efflux protein